ncbi:hypothetical protein LWI28_019188 [Acer negundo]|uniref:Uncharacterized protein n=1 Tax=Acer negundo TaxID=4023 RepID=A0AAD5J6V0_ACENE|nr:hypothetical protein LWI28_019188 [Acer negundo]
MARNDEALHVVMFPYFAFGHINPFVQLSNRLCAHGVRVSFLSAPGNISRIQSTMKLTPEAEIVPLPIPEIEGLPQGFDSTADMTPAMAEILKQAIDLLQPQISSLLSQLKPHFVIFDFAQHWVPKVASELGIKTLRFSIFATISDAYVMVPPREKSNTIDDLMRAPNGLGVVAWLPLSLQLWLSRRSSQWFDSSEDVITALGFHSGHFKVLTAVVYDV